MNDAFIALVLVVVYFVVFGIAKAIVLIAASFGKKPIVGSFWQNSKDNSGDIDFFKSSY